MVRRGSALLALCVLCAIVSSAPADGQLLEGWLKGTPLAPSQQPPSFRLSAMGGLAVSVDDENNELSLFDYAHNPAGLLEDRSTSTIDAWGRDTPWTTQTADDRRLTESTTFIGARSPGRHAVGALIGRDHVDFDSPAYSAADLRWSALRAQLVLEAEGVPHTDPNPDTLYAVEPGVPIDSSLSVRAARPVYGAIYNILLGRVALAATETYTRESEHTGRTIRYATSYGSRTWNTGLGAAVRTLPGVVLGGTVNRLDTRLTGVADGLQFQRGMAHYDTFSEKFPVWRTSAHAFVNVGPLVRGALVWERGSGDGSETYQIDWPDLIALQRTGGSVTARGTRFNDRASVTRYRTRWAAQPLGQRLTLGASWDHLRSDQSRLAAAGATPEESLLTVATFGNTHDVTTGWEGTVGGSVSLPGRATAGAEYVRGHTSLRELGDPAAETQTVERTRGGRAGIELLVLPQLGLRAGFQRLTLIDTADHLNDVTAGAGYRFHVLTADVLYTRGTSSREAGAPLPRPTIHTHTLAVITRWSL